MKKILLAGAAVVALASSPAFAQEDQGVKLDLGGHFKGYLGYVDQDETVGNEVRSFDILRSTEVHFTGETTLDNGLTVGAHIEALADRGESFDIDESYAYFSGSWGRVNFGAEDGAAYLMQVAAPSADSNYDGLRQFVSPVNYTVAPVTGGGTYGFTSTTEGLDYDQDISGSADKITYLSPVFSGFQVGASYTPENDSSRSFGNALDEQTNDQSDIIDVAVRYEGQFDGFSTNLGAGYSTSTIEGTTTAGNDDRDAWNVGADFDIGAFGIGAAYTEDNAGRDNNGDIENIVVGADYTTGPFVLGASYLNQSDEGQAANVEVDTDRYTGGVTYNYGPGMTFRGSVSYIDHSSDVATRDTDATVVLVGTQINF